MPIERPTFSESWYRVAGLTPRLRATVQIYRQHYRGHRWYIVQDPSSNQYFRLNSPGYRFVGLLDGRRTVADVWKTCNEQYGDEAPTQGEVIQLLGQLYAGNLIHAEMPPDSEGLWEEKCLFTHIGCNADFRFCFGNSVDLKRDFLQIRSIRHQGPESVTLCHQGNVL